MIKWAIAEKVCYPSVDGTFLDKICVGYPQFHAQIYIRVGYPWNFVLFFVTASDIQGVLLYFCFGYPVHCFTSASDIQLLKSDPGRISMFHPQGGNGHKMQWPNIFFSQDNQSSRRTVRGQHFKIFTRPLPNFVIAYRTVGRPLS